MISKSWAVLLLLLLMNTVDISLGWGGQGSSFLCGTNRPKKQLRLEKTLPFTENSFIESDVRQRETREALHLVEIPTDLHPFVLDYAQEPTFKLVANEHGVVAMLNGLIYHAKFITLDDLKLEILEKIEETPLQVGEIGRFELLEMESKAVEPPVAEEGNINAITPTTIDDGIRKLHHCRDLNLPFSDWNKHSTDDSEEKHHENLNEATQSKKKCKAPVIEDVMLTDNDVGLATTDQGQLYVWGHPVLVQDFQRTAPPTILESEDKESKADVQENKEKTNQGGIETLSEKVTDGKSQGLTQLKKQAKYKIAFNPSQINLIVYSDGGEVFSWNWLQHKSAESLSTSEAWIDFASQSFIIRFISPTAFYNSLLPLYEPLPGLEKKKILLIDVSAYHSAFAATENEVFGWGRLCWAFSILPRSVLYKTSYKPVPIPTDRLGENFKINSMLVVQTCSQRLDFLCSVFILSTEGNLGSYGDNEDGQLGMSSFDINREKKGRPFFDKITFPQSQQISNIQNIEGFLLATQMVALSNSGLLWSWGRSQKILNHNEALTDNRNEPYLFELLEKEKATAIATGNGVLLVATQEGNLHYSYDYGTSYKKLNKKSYGPFSIAHVRIATILQRDPPAPLTDLGKRVILYWVLRDGRIFIIPQKLRPDQEPGDPVLFYNLIQASPTPPGE